MFPYVAYVKRVSPGADKILVQGYSLNNLDRGPLDDATYQILRL